MTALIDARIIVSRSGRFLRSYRLPPYDGWVRLHWKQVPTVKRQPVNNGVHCTDYVYPDGDTLRLWYRD